MELVNSLRLPLNLMRETSTTIKKNENSALQRQAALQMNIFTEYFFSKCEHILLKTFTDMQRDEINLSRRRQVRAIIDAPHYLNLVQIQVQFFLIGFSKSIFFINVLIKFAFTC